MTANVPKDELPDMSAGWPGMGCGTSPAWYASLNEMLVLMQFLRSKGLMGEYEAYKQEHWPEKAKEIVKRAKEMWGEHYREESK